MIRCSDDALIRLNKLKWECDKDCQANAFRLRWYKKDKQLEIRYSFRLNAFAYVFALPPKTTPVSSDPKNNSFNSFSSLHLDLNLNSCVIRVVHAGEGKKCFRGKIEQRINGYQTKFRNLYIFPKFQTKTNKIKFDNFSLQQLQL